MSGETHCGWVLLRFHGWLASRHLWHSDKSLPVAAAGILGACN